MILYYFLILCRIFKWMLHHLTLKTLMVDWVTMLKNSGFPTSERKQLNLLTFVFKFDGWPHNGEHTEFGSTFAAGFTACQPAAWFCLTRFCVFSLFQHSLKCSPIGGVGLLQLLSAPSRLLLHQQKNARPLFPQTKTRFCSLNNVATHPINLHREARHGLRQKPCRACFFFFFFS